jgi:hypothetical protein
LSAAHASFHDDCRACHQQPLAPLRSDAVDLRHWSDPRRGREVAEGGCQRCHEMPGHHASAHPDEVPRCAACHREHRSQTDLRRTADAQCTRCHAAIAAHRQGDSQWHPALADVSAFAAGPSHPSFRSLASGDPGNVRFNHWLHLQPGVAPPFRQRKLRPEDLPPPHRQRYAARDDGLIQLGCADCHQPDAGAGGAHMRPIAYAEHCQACHPLHVALGPDDPPRAVPHGMDRTTLAAFLDGLLIAQSLLPPHSDAAGAVGAAAPQEGAALSAGTSDDLPLVPGRTLGRNLAQRLAADLGRQRTVARRAVAGQCLQCHLPRGPVASAPAQDDPFPELPELAPAAIPSRWLAHARFDHSAHRHVACRQCHAAAYRFEQPEPAQLLSPPAQDARFLPARDADEVMIADRDTCLRCHAPRRQGQGGARHDCTGCHNYHGQDHGKTLGLDPLASPPASGHVDLDLSQRAPMPPPKPLPSTMPLRLVNQAFANQVSERQTSTNQVSPRPTYVEEWSCAAAGCHGSPRADASPSARAALTWLNRDPHREAEELLWTTRARQMTARLASPSALPQRIAPPTDPQPNASAEKSKTSDDQHLFVLARRCVACHAVPGAHLGRNAPINSGVIGENKGVLKAMFGLAGVSCQACHGPASHWLSTHDWQTFDRKTPGFIDTKPLARRAATCMPCHVGPAAGSDGTLQAVDHDLIAAGHPRLAFDFFAYFESLPAHWDRHRDQEKHSGFYHFALWRAGHEAQVAQEAHLAQWLASATRSPAAEEVAVPEFSTIDCQACHHSLVHPVPRPPAAMLWRPRVVGLSLTESLEAGTPSLGDRLEAAAKALENVATEELTFDTACRMYGLVRAVAADLPTRAGSIDDGRPTNLPGEAQVGVDSALASSLAAAGAYLGRESFPEEVWRLGGPTLYDGPTRFTPAAWSRHRDALAAGLRQVRRNLAGGQATGEAQKR